MTGARHVSISVESGQPHVLVPENDYGIEPGARDVVRLLRENADRPEVIRFIADMLEM